MISFQGFCRTHTQTLNLLNKNSGVKTFTTPLVKKVVLQPSLLNTTTYVFGNGIMLQMHFQLLLT